MIDGRIIEGAMIGIAIVSAVVGAVVGAVLCFGLPLLWGWIKPIIHAWTA